MLHIKCRICKNTFSPRPSHVKLGWGVYCSLECKHIGAQIRTKVKCFICDVSVSRTPGKISSSKSGKFFCSKSCQTKWRNVEFSREKHAGWKGGSSTYKNILLKNGKVPKCWHCHKTDTRILAVHHIDEDHTNNKLKNLAWLCHNCHYLVHHDSVEKNKFLSQKFI